MREDQQVSYGMSNVAHIIHSLAFACLPEIFRLRMERDPVYMNWVYEVVDEEDNRPLTPRTNTKLEEARRMEDQRLAEDRKREDQIKMIEQFYKDEDTKKFETKRKEQKDGAKNKKAAMQQRIQDMRNGKVVGNSEIAKKAD